MESLALSPTSANQDLTAVLVSPKNVLFNQSVWNHLVSTSEVMCWIDPCLPPWESDLAWNNLLFANKLPFPTLFLPLKTFPFL